MDENELLHLVTLIGALRAARTEDSIFATVVQEESESARGAAFSVRARTKEGTYEYDEVGTGHSVVYSPSEGSLAVTCDAESLSKSHGNPHFPMFAPVLGMLSPLDLPIWGGSADSNTVTSVRPGPPGHMRVEFGHKEEPFHADSRGYAIIDLALGVVMEMEFQGKHFTTANVRTLPLLRGFDREFDF